MATILIDKNVMVPMRDGVHLATDIYRLAGAPPAPCCSHALQDAAASRKEGSIIPDGT